MRIMANIAVVFGGQSGEHEVSIQSAKYVIKILESDEHNIIPVLIDKQGRWFAKMTPEQYEQDDKEKTPLIFDLTEKKVDVKKGYWITPN